MKYEDGGRVTIDYSIDGHNCVTSRHSDGLEGFVPDISLPLVLCLENSGLPRVLAILAKAVVEHIYPLGFEQEELEFIEAAKKHIKWWVDKDEKRELEKQAT